MKNKLLIMFLFIAAFVCFAAMEQNPADAYATPGQKELNYTSSRFTTAIKVTGAVGVDTVTSAISLPKYAILKSVWIVVADTVESRGDSALVKLLVGSTEIMSQRTSAFKLGLSTAPRAFNFTASTLYSTIPSNFSVGNQLSYRITQTAASAGTGITEGTFYMIVEYIMPFRTNGLP